MINALRIFGQAALIGGMLIATTLHAEPLPPNVPARIDSIFADTRPDAPGYAVAVIKEGKIVYQAGYGLANLDDHIPINGQTAFHLASLSKQFTAAAIALLIIDGRLALSDPVVNYIPEAASSKGLEVRHLLYMTSGLVEYTDVRRQNGIPWFSGYYFTDTEAIVASLARAPKFAPGSQWDYSNVNYMLLARIVEKVSGQPFPAFVDQRLFAPLGMTDSRIDGDTTAVIPHRATGYAARTPEVVKEFEKIGMTISPQGDWVRLVRVSPHFGGSGVFSTLEDLAKWQAALDEDRPVAGFVALMTRRERFAHPKDNDALGLVWRRYRGLDMLDYAGRDIDANSYMARFAKQKMAVICLSNLPFGDCEARAHQVIDILIDSHALQP